METIIPVHPRACGEHAAGALRLLAIIGSSPRLRGTLSNVRRINPIHRFIPAPAGNTTRLKADDPKCAGSSPRLRGTPTFVGEAVRIRRFIPAPAGNTRSTHLIVTTTPVHPRACGEHPGRHSPTNVNTGSSPRLRGTPGTSPDRCARPRFIPAPAGNTLFGGLISNTATVHPRACGEHQATLSMSVSPAGSSPRLRGTPSCSLRGRVPTWFIPAPAGNTKHPAMRVP